MEPNKANVVVIGVFCFLFDSFLDDIKVVNLGKGIYCDFRISDWRKMFIRPGTSVVGHVMFERKLW